MLKYGRHITDWYGGVPTVFSDSAYCVNTFNDWMFRWANNGWIKSDKQVPENLDLIQAYYDHYQKGYRIELIKVKGHSGNKWNEMADDLATLVYNLAGLLDNDMEFNQIFRENFKNIDNINLINGQHNIGSLESKNNILEFQLNEAKAIDSIPSKFKLKHYIEMVGVVGIECNLTFNGLDDEPFWFNANDAILDGSFFEIPEFEKEENIPYALNINIKCNCEANSSVKISDIMVVFI